MPTPTPEQIQALKNYVEKNNPSLEQIEQLDVTKLGTGSQ